MLFPQGVAIGLFLITSGLFFEASTQINFASLVGGTCGPSPENPNVVHFVDSKNSNRDVTEHT